MFKKNDQIAVLSSWDNKGAVRIRRGRVHSCGAKVLRIEWASTGELAKVAFDPQSNEMGSFNGRHIVPDADDATLIAMALSDGASVIAQNIKIKNSAIAHYTARDGVTANQAFLSSVARDVAELEASTASAELVA